MYSKPPPRGLSVGALAPAAVPTKCWRSRPVPIRYNPAPMKLSHEWLGEYVDLTGFSEEQIARRLTEIGHAVEGVEKHGEDTVFETEITTNRVDAMSHMGMARELAAAFGREPVGRDDTLRRTKRPPANVPVRIDAPRYCSRYTGLVIRNVTVQSTPEVMRRRLEAVGIRPINNVVDVTNYVMLGLGHPLHAFDLDRLKGPEIVVRAGRRGESMRSLDGEMRTIDEETIVIADAERPVALGGIIGGAESEITESTKNVFLECAWFEPSAIRRTARRLGIKTDASYRFERRVDANDTTTVIDFAALLISEYAGGKVSELVDVVARVEPEPRVRLHGERLRDASAGVIGEGYALELFRRLGFETRTVADAIEVKVPSYRGDLREEQDLIEEVLRFYGLDKIPSILPRLTTGDARPNPMLDVEDETRRVLVGCGLTEVVNYSFLSASHNPLFSDETPIAVTNALSENVAAMRLSLLPGLLETVAYNRAYGTRDGALFEVGRTYHRTSEGIRERHAAAFVMYGAVGSHWAEAKRQYDFFDIKGVAEAVAGRWHVALELRESDDRWYRRGRRAAAYAGDRVIARLGTLATEILQAFDIKGEVLAGEIDLEALLASTAEWKMSAVPRYPGVPMVLGLLHGPDLSYQRLHDAIRSLETPHLQEIGLRDRFVPDDSAGVVKTTLGMWYQAFDRSLTQDEVAASQQRLAARLTELLPVKLIQ